MVSFGGKIGENQFATFRRLRQLLLRGRMSRSRNEAYITRTSPCRRPQGADGRPWSVEVDGAQMRKLRCLKTPLDIFFGIWHLTMHTQKKRRYTLNHWSENTHCGSFWHVPNDTPTTTPILVNAPTACLARLENQWVTKSLLVSIDFLFETVFFRQNQEDFFSV